ncbi:hypothetical protein FQ775_14980 [Nitratireductor mangrovi]|uniref:Uncharacterized protein n=1 Tax=Nitratireductor mangrovi TaxID=2599600 RepID=A0A5B8L0V9_9HYPH|nr:hypothetical protein [Nitratireductor mangrovi]QDZ01575.1 hypothetical protein FQ775_14980 [Nitratireductor mangrovi]
MTVRALLVATALLGLAACDLPRDPERTSQRVRDGQLVVGHVTGAPISAEEGNILRRVADSLSASVRIVDGNAHELVEMLDRGAVHIVAGRLPEDTPFADRMGLTKPVGTLSRGSETVATVFAVRQGENAFLRIVNRVIGERRE